MIYWSNKEPQIIRRLLPFSPRPKDRYSHRANIFYLALCNVTEKKNKCTALQRATWLAAPPSPPAASAQASLPGSWGRIRALHAPSQDPFCCSSHPQCLLPPASQRKQGWPALFPQPRHSLLAAKRQGDPLLPDPCLSTPRRGGALGVEGL